MTAAIFFLLGSTALLSMLFGLMLMLASLHWPRLEDIAPRFFFGGAFVLAGLAFIGIAAYTIELARHAF